MNIHHKEVGHHKKYIAHSANVGVYMVNLLFNLSFQQNRKQISNSNVHYVMVSHGLMIGCIFVSIFL